MQWLCWAVFFFKPRTPTSINYVSVFVYVCFSLIFLATVLCSFQGKILKTDRKHRMKMLFTHTHIFSFRWFIRILRTVRFTENTFPMFAYVSRFTLTSQLCLESMNMVPWLAQQQENTSKLRKFREKMRLIKHARPFITTIFKLIESNNQINRGQNSYEHRNYSFYVFSSKLKVVFFMKSQTFIPGFSLEPNEFALFLRWNICFEHFRNIFEHFLHFSRFHSKTIYFHSENRSIVQFVSSFVWLVNNVV